MMSKIIRFNRKSRLIVGLIALVLIGVASLAQAISDTPPGETTRALYAMLGKVVLAGFAVGTLQWAFFAILTRIPDIERWLKGAWRVGRRGSQ